MLLHTRRGRVYDEDERPQIDVRHGEGEEGHTVSRTASQVGD